MGTMEKIEYLKLLFDQVKLQQEVRDRWFQYYLTIAGAVFAAGIAAVQFFYNKPHISQLYMVLFLLALSMSFIGYCFFRIYLGQRRNYLSLYKVMASLEQQLYSTTEGEAGLKPVAEIPKLPLEQTRRYGADYYTAWIHIFVNSFYLATALILGVGLLFDLSSKSSLLISIATFTFSVYFLYRDAKPSFEPKGGKNGT